MHKMKGGFTSILCHQLLSSASFGLTSEEIQLILCISYWEIKITRDGATETLLKDGLLPHGISLMEG